MKVRRKLFNQWPTQTVELGQNSALYTSRTVISFTYLRLLLAATTFFTDHKQEREHSRDTEDENRT